MPQRIAKIFPSIKLIAILRDPIDRAYSHYKMEVRRGNERRSFEDAIRQQLDSLTTSRNMAETDAYVAWGEYGRILKAYFDVFDKTQIKIIHMDSLNLNPREVIFEIQDFLEIVRIEPKSIGKVFHKGGIGQKFPKLKSRLKSNVIFKKLWQILKPSMRRRLRYWFDQWNVSKRLGQEIDKDSPIVADLVKHYDNDCKQLRNLTNIVS